MYSFSENNNEKPRDRSDQSQSPQNYSSGPVQRGSETSNDKPWNYSGMDLMSPGAAAFWQNYSGKNDIVIIIIIYCIQGRRTYI